MSCPLSLYAPFLGRKKRASFMVHLSRATISNTACEKQFCFSPQFAAVCQASLKELPKLTMSLDMLDARLDTLCKEYKVPPPQPPGQHTQDSNATDNDNNNTVDLKAASHAVEKNRGRLTHSKHQAQDLVENMKNALKKTRTAFVW